MVNMDKKNWLPWLYLALALTQAAHSIEEVLTGLWRWMPVVSGALHGRVQSIPVMSWSEQGFAAANMVIIALMLGFSPLVFINRTWTWTVATVVAVIETINGIFHSTTAILYRAYSPGCITAVALILLSVPIWGRKWIFKEKRQA